MHLVNINRPRQGLIVLSPLFLFALAPVLSPLLRRSWLILIWYSTENYLVRLVFQTCVIGRWIVREPGMVMDCLMRLCPWQIDFPWYNPVYYNIQSYISLISCKKFNTALRGVLTSYISLLIAEWRDVSTLIMSRDIYYISEAVR